MKNLLDIQKEFDTLAEVKRDDDPKGWRKAQLRAEFLKTVRLYLEFSKPEDIIKRDLETVKTRLSKIETDYPIWKKNQALSISEPEEKLLARYYTEMERAKLMKQRKTLEYIFFS